MKKVAVLVCLLGICMSLCSCAEKNPAPSADSSNSASVSQSANQNTVTDKNDRSDNNEEKDENYISPERKNQDYDNLSKSASELLKLYYAGITDEDYSKWKKTFPDFYLKAMEDEGKQYNQTNEEFLIEINTENKAEYGDDYYAYAEEPAILQITDVSLDILKEEIKETFGVDADLRDAYSINYNAVVRGSKNKTTSTMEFFMLNIGGTNYLYDQYYTEMMEQ